MPIKSGGQFKMVLFGDIAGVDADAVARHQRGGAPGQQGSSGEGFIAISPEARKKFWLDRAHRRHFTPHQRLQDQRRRRSPLPRMWPNTPDGIERINIELAANKLRLCDELEALPSAAATCRWPRKARAARCPVPSCSTSAWRRH